MGLVSHGGVGLALVGVGTAVLDWVLHSLALCLSPSQRHDSLSLSVTATRASKFDQDGLDGSLYSLSLSLSLSCSSRLSLSFLSFFLFFLLCFLLSPFGVGLLRAEFFNYF